MFRIFHNTKYDFIKFWRIAVGLTVAFIALGAGSFLFTGSVRYSIEFTGGTLMQLRFAEAPDVAELRSTLEASGAGNVELQQFGTNTEYVVRAQDAAQVAAQEGQANSVERQLREALDAKYGEAGYTVASSEAVGPKVGSELRRGAIIALIIASFFTLFYLAIRFDWRFGIAAVVATVHDVFITLAFIKMFDIEVSLTIVAAVLTLLGYSANDTIIIFDRVRENLRKQFKEPLYDTLNRSINETLPRSVMTHATTLAAVLALLAFAGGVIRPFAVVMAFGVIVATFSSMYVAGPMLLLIERRYPRAASDPTGRAVRAGEKRAADAKAATKVAAAR